LTGRRQRIDVTYQRGHGTLAPIVQAIEHAGASLENLAIDDDEERRCVRLTIYARDPSALREDFAGLASLPEVDAVVFDAQLADAAAT
jgi:hypothetical protein